MALWQSASLYQMAKKPQTNIFYLFKIKPKSADLQAFL